MMVELKKFIACFEVEDTEENYYVWDDVEDDLREIAQRYDLNLKLRIR